MSNNQYRFTLKPYKTPSDRETCPSCGYRRKYARYIDTHTGDYLPEPYGRCDREEGCSYHLNPYEDGYHKIIYQQERGQNASYKRPQPPKPKPAPKPVSYIQLELFKQSLQRYEDNYFIMFLRSTFNDEVVQQILNRYWIGTSKEWPGATIFWQVDRAGRVRTGKIMLYSQLTGKRVKRENETPTWVHKRIADPDFNLSQCLFGEDLLELEPYKTVAMVESEKTAIIASIYFPQFVWVSTGGKGFNDDKIQALRGRKVILFPDLSKEGKAFSDWANKAQQSANLTSFVVSDFLEVKAREQSKDEEYKWRERGIDLADYLLEINFDDYQRQQAETGSLPQPDQPEKVPDDEASQPEPLPPGVHTLTNATGKAFDLEINTEGYPAIFDTEAQEQTTLDTLIQELDLGKPWDLICRHCREQLPATVTPDSLPEYFKSLGYKYLSMLVADERREFIKERYARGNYTNFGIVEHYPCFGLSDEFRVIKFMQG